MSGTNFLTLKDGISEYLEQIISRARAMQGYLGRNVVRQFQGYAKQRWMTENASEGDHWAPILGMYAQSKRKRYKGYPGSGSKMLIATGRLFESVVKTSGDTRIIATPKTITISTGVPYAPYVQEKREFMELGHEHLEEILEGILEFMMDVSFG